MWCILLCTFNQDVFLFCKLLLCFWSKTKLYNFGDFDKRFKWGPIELHLSRLFRSSISGVLDQELIVLYQVKVIRQDGKYLVKTDSSKWCDHISCYGHLRSWENKHQDFSFLFFSEGLKSKSVCQQSIDPKDVLRHGFSLIIPFRRLKVAILKWLDPLVNFYLHSGRFLLSILYIMHSEMADSPNNWPIPRNQQEESATLKSPLLAIYARPGK